jgi:hypothetical protein
VAMIEAVVVVAGGVGIGGGVGGGKSLHCKLQQGCTLQ